MAATLPVTAARVWDMPVLPSLYKDPVGVGHRTCGWSGWDGRSVVLGERALDVVAGQQDEDVRLDGLDEQLEGGHHDGHHERGGGVDDTDPVQQVPGRDGEHHDQQVA